MQDKYINSEALGVRGPVMPEEEERRKGRRGKGKEEEHRRGIALLS